MMKVFRKAKIGVLQKAELLFRPIEKWGKALYSSVRRGDFC